MADDTDVLLKMYEQDWEQARQAEGQRATVTNIILVIISAIVGFIAQAGLSLQTLPLTLLLILIGIYGALITQKLYVVFRKHVRRLQAWRKRLDEMHPNAQILKLVGETTAAHTAEYPRLEKLPLHHLWLVLYLAFALIGVVLTLVVITR